MAMGEGFEHDVDAEKRASFFVRVLFRQNGTLQGEVQWMEGKKTTHFRSALELLGLMNDAAAAAGVPEGESNRRQWATESSVQSESGEQPIHRQVVSK